MVNRIVVPLPGSLDAAISPPCASTRLRAMANPRPAPPESAVLTNRSKMWGRTSTGTPDPESETANPTRSPARSAAINTEPSGGVCRIAFDSMLARTWPIRTRSTSISGRPSAVLASSVIPASAAEGPNAATASSSRRDIPRLSSSTGSRCVRSAWYTPSRIPSILPRITDSGVRSSWARSARRSRRWCSAARSRSVISLKARASRRVSRGPRSSTRASWSPAATRSAASMTSPTGPATRRTAHTATAKRAPSSSRPRIAVGTRSALRSPTPSAPETTITASALVANSRRKNVANAKPTRRRKRRRRPAHHGPPRGGKGSFSGHHGGRNPRPGPHRRWSPIGEPVADAVDGQEVSGPAGHRLDLLPDVLHVCVDGPLVRLEGDAVHRVEELGAREHSPRLSGHGGHELELRRREVDRPAADRDPHPGHVDLDIANPNDLRHSLRGRLGPPEHRPDPGHELLRAERLDHVIVGAELEAHEPVRLVAAGGEDHDRDR